MPTNFYHMTDKMLSNVGQLNSSGRVFNEFRVTYSRERNKRGGQPGADFPEVRVDMRTAPPSTSNHARRMPTSSTRTSSR